MLKLNVHMHTASTMYTHSQAHMHTDRRTQTPICIRARTQTRIHGIHEHTPCIWLHARRQMRICIHTQIHAHTRVNVYAYTYIGMYAHRLAHTQT